MPQNPALILGVCCRGGQTIPSPGSQKAAWPHPAPLVWLDRQKSANQSQFPCDTCVFQSWLCHKTSLVPWAALGNIVHVSLSLPPLPFFYTDDTITKCVSAGHFTDDFFLISTKHPQGKLSHQFPNFRHHPEGAKHEVLQALLQHQHPEGEVFLGTRHQTQLTPQQNHPTEQLYFSSSLQALR